MNRLQLLLAVAICAPCCFFLASFLVESGLDLPLWFDQLLANNISTFFAVDLILMAIAFLLFSNREAARLRMGNCWVYLAATLAVGLSFAQPLFLHVRAGVLTEEVW